LKEAKTNKKKQTKNIKKYKPNIKENGKRKKRKEKESAYLRV